MMISLDVVTKNVSDKKILKFRTLLYTKILSKYVTGKTILGDYNRTIKKFNKDAQVRYTSNYLLRRILGYYGKPATNFRYSSSVKARTVSVWTFP